MKGAHSIKKPRRKGKAVAIVICVALVLAAAGVAAYAVVTGWLELPFAATAPESVPKSDDASELGEVAERESADLSGADAAGNGSAGDAADLQVYKNVRFGYQVDIPEGFTLGSEADDGARITLVNSTLRMTADAFGFNNVDHLDADAVLASIWNGTEDSIARAEGNRVIIYQYDDEYEYFYWVYIGSGSIDQMEIRYPLQDDNRDELEAAQSLMQGFTPGDLNAAH